MSDERKVPCSLCGALTQAEAGSVRGCAWVLCEDCVDTEAAEEAGYTHLETVVYR